MTSLLGVDFGGTWLRAAAVDPHSGQVSGLLKSPTPSREGPAAVIAALVALTRQVRAACPAVDPPIAVGIGCPAFVDQDHGRLLNVPNIAGNWPEIPLQAALAAEIGLPVFLINDVRAITLGEWTFGAGRGVDTLACYAIGTGIGGGVVINNRLHLGISGSAGELGHQIIDPRGAYCNCGSRGCLETLASGPAITALAAQAVISRKSTMITTLAENDLNRITPGVVVEAARRGDEIAINILDQAGTAIGIALVNTLVTISPRRILIGGGVAEAAGDLLLNPIQRTVRERCFMTPVDQVVILPTQLGDTAGLLGAALWAFHQENN